MSSSEEQQTSTSQFQPEQAPLKFHPLNSSINLITSQSLALYNKLAPQFVADYLSGSELVSRGLKGAEKGWEMVKPAVDTVDSYSSHLIEWSQAKYQKLFLNRLHSLITGLKKFYSSENNDYARITLKLLTKLLPNPELIHSVTEAKFIEYFRADPKFSSEKVQLIIRTMFKNAQQYWAVTKESRPTEIIRSILFIVAATMEEIVITATDRVEHFAERVTEYFLDKVSSAEIFCQEKFRQHVCQVMDAQELSEGLKRLADEYLQIASVLFDLTNMSNRDLVDWSVKRFIQVKNQVKQLYRVCKQNLDFVLQESIRIPHEAYDFTSKKTLAVVQVGRETFLSLSLKIKQLEAIQYCLNIAQKVDLALRHNVESVKRILKKNEEAFMAFIGEYQQELVTFIRSSSATVTKYSKETKEALLQVLEKQKIRALNIAELGKETMDMLYDVSAQFLYKEKEMLTQFFVKNSALLQEETKALGSLVFKVLRVDEIASIVARNLAAAEEYLCIRESLSKLDVLTFDSASEIYEKQLLAPAASE